MTEPAPATEAEKAAAAKAAEEAAAKAAKEKSEEGKLDAEKEAAAKAKAKEDAINAKLAAAEKELKAFRDKEKAAADAEKTAAEKLAEREKELATAKREALVERVRRAHGFGDKVYDVVAAVGETEDEIKAAYEAHKTALDEYVKAQGVKSAPGGGTGGGKTPDGKDSKPENTPYLVKMGIVKPAKAV